MKMTSSLLLSALCVLPMKAQEVYLHETFESGIPATFTTFDEDELPVKNGFKIPVIGDWFAQAVYGNNGKSAVSTSANDFDLPVANWLITPAFEVRSANAVLSWDAKSVHYDLRDGYRVLVSTTGNQPEDFVEIARIAEESYTWKHHALSLEAYAGKKIHVALVHDSNNRFLLAVDNLFAGVPAQAAFEAENQTKHFCGINSTHARVEGIISNTGSAAEVKEIVCTSGLRVLSQAVNRQMATGDSIRYFFELPTALDTAIPYRIEVKTTAGESVTVADDQLFCSYYPRTLLVEKGTGVWCTSCPSVMGYLNELKEKYGDEVVLIESHSTYNDQVKLSYAPYDEGMATSNYPIIYFNRNQKYKSYSKRDAEATLEEVLTESTPALVEASATMQNGKIAVKTTLSFGKELDNAKDKYRVGFAILKKHLQLPFPIQKNAVSGPEYQEYGLLTSPFNKDFMFFHNIVEGTPSAFKGVANSLPAHIEAGTSFTQEHLLDLPAGATSPEGLTVVTFILDYFNTRVLNTTECAISDAPLGITSAKAETLQASVRLEGDRCSMRLPDTAGYTLEMFNEKGQCLCSKSGRGDRLEFSLSGYAKGSYLLRLQQNGQLFTQKIFKD